MKIFHNPRCRKSRETLALIEENNITPEIILYLDNIPTERELKSLLKKLSIPADKLIRKGEAIFKEKYKGKSLTEAQWISAMVKYPKLIERPIVVDGGKAVLGRPPENVLELLK